MSDADMKEVEADSLPQHIDSSPQLRGVDLAPQRIKAHEILIFWSWVAVGIIIVMTTLILVIGTQWYTTDCKIRELLVMTSTNSATQANMDLYTTLSNQVFERSWQLVDRLVMGGFMSLLTLIIGYVFGAHQRSKDKDKNTEDDPQ